MTKEQIIKSVDDGILHPDDAFELLLRTGVPDKDYEQYSDAQLEALDSILLNHDPLNGGVLVSED